MEKQKYLYKNSKCGGTTSTVSLINAWISITGQRNIQKYRSIAYLGGFTIVALATIWFLSQSPTYTIEYDSNDKSEKSNKSDKSKLNKKEDDTGKMDKRSNNTNKSSANWWSSTREKIANKLGFSKKAKFQKSTTKIGKSSSSRNNNILNNSTKNGRSNVKKRVSSKTSEASSNGSNGSNKIKNNTHNGKSTKVQGSRYGNSSNRQREITQKDLVGCYSESSSSNSNDLHQKDQEIRVVSYGNFTSNNNEVKQQQVRKLKCRVEVAHSPYWTNRGDKYWLRDISTSRYYEKVNSTSLIHNVKCITKSCQDSKELNRPLTEIEKRIADMVKKISLIDIQVRENCQEFYIPYAPLTLHKTFDKIEQERFERDKKLLLKLWRQKREDSNLESTLQMVQEFFHEKRYYDISEDDDYFEKLADNSDGILDYIQNISRTKVTDNNISNCNKCPKFSSVIIQGEQASRKRIEKDFEILKMIDSYQQQGKETEANINKVIGMFNEQSEKCKGATRHLKQPARFHDELNRLEERLMDIEQQTKNLVESLDDMEAYFTETLELFNDDSKMDSAVAKYGPLLIDDD